MDTDDLQVVDLYPIYNFDTLEDYTYRQPL